MKKKTDLNHDDLEIVHENCTDESTCARRDGQSEDTLNKDAEFKNNIYLEIIKSLFEKNRKRVSTYYCSSLSCKNTFWNAKHGFECPLCGTFGIISQFKSQSSSEGSQPKKIIGYLDNIGRLVCKKCIHDKGIDDDVGFIVYSGTQPYCYEHCELCRESLG